jgi:hypothetical protein
MFNNFFPLENFAVCDKMSKNYSRAGKATNELISLCAFINSPFILF